MVFISAHCLVMLYISTKFCKIISNRIKVIVISILKISKGNNSAKNVGGVNVVNLCTSSGHAIYICVKFHEIILNGIKVIEWTRFLYEKLQRGIIPQKM